MIKFTNAQKFNKTNVKNLPEDKPVVYRLLNNSNKELYTGIAKRNRLQDRLSEHLNVKKEKISGATKIKNFLAELLYLSINNGDITIRKNTNTIQMI